MREEEKPDTTLAARSATERKERAQINVSNGDERADRHGDQSSCKRDGQGVQST